MQNGNDNFGNDYTAARDELPEWMRNANSKKEKETAGKALKKNETTKPKTLERQMKDVKEIKKIT